MHSSDSIAKLAEALSAAQGEFPAVPKEQEGKVEFTRADKTTGSYKYRYADLSSIQAQIQPILTKYGLAITQMPEVTENGKDVLTTRLMHLSGEWIEGTMRLFLTKETSQIHGSAITYARRYAYSAVLQIPLEDDDDGARGQAYGTDSNAAVSQSRGRASGKPDTTPVQTPRPENPTSTAQTKDDPNQKLVKALNEAGATKAFLAWRKQAGVLWPETPEQIAAVKGIIAAARTGTADAAPPAEPDFGSYADEPF